MSRLLMLVLAFAALACDKSTDKSASRPVDPPALQDDERAHEEAPRSLEDELERADADEYEPTPLDLPLTTDFAKAAGKRVTAETYKKELARIERELAYELRQSDER